MDEARKRYKAHTGRRRRAKNRSGAAAGDGGPYGRLPPVGDRKAADSGRLFGVPRLGTLADVWPGARP